jgi:predicted phosphodiesterase
MKIAVIADAHANLAALQTVVEHIEAWQPDQVIVLGDLVNRGPRPAECLELVLENVRTRGWLLVRGNHEEYVISRAAPDAPRKGPEAEVHRPSYWTYQQLGCDVSALQSMPYQVSLSDPIGGEVAFYHGSVLGLRAGIYPETSDRSLLKKTGLDNRPPGAPPLSMFCVGHTHRPLVRSLNGTCVVNAGSAGLPFDGDIRTGYAQLTWQPTRRSSQQEGAWQAEIIRLPYDTQQAERDFYLNGYLDGGGPLAGLVLIELQTASSLLYTWAAQYQERAACGEITLDDSVRQYLASLGYK